MIICSVTENQLWRGLSHMPNFPFLPSSFLPFFFFFSRRCMCLLKRDKEKEGEGGSTPSGMWSHHSPCSSVCPSCTFWTHKHMCPAWLESLSGWDSNPSSPCQIWLSSSLSSGPRPLFSFFPFWFVCFLKLILTLFLP